MHANEVRATPETVAALVRTQFPQWADRPVEQVAQEGTDHVLFRLGDDLLARLPKIDWALDQAESDARWLPVLGPHLPVPVPTPCAVGEPGEGYPWRWTVVPWLPGENPDATALAEPGLAREVADLVLALQRVDPSDGPTKPDRSRGTPLAQSDGTARRAITTLRDRDDGFDLDLVEQVWQDCLDAPESRDPVWIHGDLQPGNLLVADGHLSAVIDFGALGVGDPAPDVAAAFWTFTGAARAAYRQAVGCDEATWRRARGWALLPSLTGIEYYRETSPQRVEHGLASVTAVLDDVREHGF